MSGWHVEWRDDDVHVTHEHDDGKPLAADLTTDVHGYRQAQCPKCQAVLPIDRDTEDMARIRG